MNKYKTKQEFLSSIDQEIENVSNAFSVIKSELPSIEKSSFSGNKNPEHKPSFILFGVLVAFIFSILLTVILHNLGSEDMGKDYYWNKMENAMG